MASMAVPPPLPADAKALLKFADETQSDEARKDKELAEKSEAIAFNGQIGAAKNSVAQNRKAADERLQAAKDKTSGGIIGAIVGIVLLVVCIVATCFCPALAVPLLMLGAALLASGSTIGGLFGNLAAEDNEDAANVAQENADEAKVEEKEMEKRVEEYSDRSDKAEDFRKQILDSQRNRNDEYRQSKVKG